MMVFKLAAYFKVKFFNEVILIRVLQVENNVLDKINDG